MRVPPWAVVTAAFAIKLWLWWRTAPIEVHHIICIVSLWLLVAVMAAIWMKRAEEPDHRPAEFICSDPAQRRPDYDYELCEFKMRFVRLGHSAPKRTLIAAQTI